MRLQNTSIQSKTTVDNSTRVPHHRQLGSFTCIRPQKLSTTALSKASPSEILGVRMPVARKGLPKAQQAYWVNSSGLGTLIENRSACWSKIGVL